MRCYPPIARHAKAAGVATLVALALAGGVASADAQARPVSDGVIVSDDCTGHRKPYSYFEDTTAVWCPPSPPEEAYL
jgi:hypothetical protein